MHKTLVRPFYERDVGRRCKSTSRWRRLRGCMALECDSSTNWMGDWMVFKLRFQISAFWEDVDATHDLLSGWGDHWMSATSQVAE